jgi:hypothetical protein
MRFKPGISGFARQQRPFPTPAAVAGSIIAQAVSRTKMFHFYAHPLGDGSKRYM